MSSSSVAVPKIPDVRARRRGHTGVLRLVSAMAAAIAVGVLALTVPDTCQGQFLGSPQIFINPSDPTASDRVRITVDTHALCYPVAPGDGIVTAVSGATIQIVATLTCTILQPPPPTFVFSQDIGPLAEGPYQVQYFYRSGSGSPLLLATATFSVAAASASPIPTTDRTAIAVLSVLLTITAILAIRRLRNASRLLVLGVCIGLAGQSQEPSAAGIPSPDRPPEILSRQVILLFDPATAGNPSPDQIVSAARSPQTDSPLSLSLGSPIDGRQLMEGLTSPALQAQLAKTPTTPRGRLERYVVLTYPDPTTAANAQRLLSQDPRVSVAAVNNRYSFSTTTITDTYFNCTLPVCNPSSPTPGRFQWGMQLLNMPSAWDKVRGSAYIAAMDNGVYCTSSIGTCLTHSDLQQNLRTQFSVNVAGGTINETTYPGHGTHVAGIMSATAQNSTGVAGACWTCSFAMIRFDSSFDAAPAAVAYAVDHGMQVLNWSGGDEYVTDPITQQPKRYSGCSSQGGLYQATCDALAYARDRDVVVVAASGNRYEQRIQYPAQSIDVIAVGAIKYGGSFYDYGYGNGNDCSNGLPGDECGSNYGVQEDGVTRQLVAPAKDVVSTQYYGATYN
jgi:hypothetical protein